MLDAFHVRAKKADSVGLLDLKVVKAETVCDKATGVGPAKLEGHVWLGQEGEGWEARLRPMLVMTKQNHLTEDWPYLERKGGIWLDPVSGPCQRV